MRPYQAISSLIFALLLMATACPGEELLRLPPSDGAALDLVEAESLALTNSPTIARAEALVRAAQYNTLQAGLPPNPTFGYTASEIGAEGGSGQQGIFVGQQFVRGGKLKLDRAVARREAQRRRELFAAEVLRVRNDVRNAYAAAYFAQQEALLMGRLARVGENAAQNAQELLDAQEGRRSDLLLAHIDAERAKADVAAAQAQQEGTWRELAALCGVPDLPPGELSFNASDLRIDRSFDELFEQLLLASPEVSAAMAAVERARCQLAREQTEPTPDLNAAASVQYDDSLDETIAGVQLGVKLPLWNRNQGGIGRARAELTAARRTLDATERRLRLQLAKRFQMYEASVARAEAFRDSVLDRAEENLSLVASGYRAGETGFLDVLTAQRTYFRVNLDYLTAQRKAVINAQLIEGSLLMGSLAKGPPTEAP